MEEEKRVLEGRETNRKEMGKLGERKRKLRKERNDNMAQRINELRVTLKRIGKKRKEVENENEGVEYGKKEGKQGQTD